MTDVEKIEKVIKKKFNNLEKYQDYGWYCPALNVLDCVLSLNRAYQSFVVPRIELFSVNNPNVTDLRDLDKLIRKYSSPLMFSKKELRYNDRRRAETLVGVIKYLLKVQKIYHHKTERARLRAWAISANPAELKNMKVTGFGLSGFQYLRMLFGAQTIKPDIHIKRFVSEIIGRNVSDIVALTLLEEAARKNKLLLREVDGAIWRERARK